MSVITLNGETLPFEPKLSTPAEILKYGPKGDKATLTLKMVKIFPEQVKNIKDRDEPTPFCEYHLIGSDPKYVIKAEAWGRNVELIKQHLPLNSVFKIKFVTKKLFKASFIKELVPFMLNFGVKNTQLNYPDDPNALMEPQTNIPDDNVSGESDA